MPDQPTASPPGPARSPALRALVRRDAVFAMLGIVLVALLAGFQPDVLLREGHAVGYAVCHQIPARSFFLNGRPLPLCARCTGTFAGAMIGFTAIFLRRRQHAGNLPPAPLLIVLGLFMLAWAGDGLNSYLTLFDGAPHLYEPQNWLRLATGLLNGIALATLVFPVFAASTWTQLSEARALGNVKELGLLVAVAAGALLIMLSGWPPLVYLLSLVSLAGVLALLLLVNTLLALVVLRRENKVAGWRGLILPLIIGAALGAGEIAAIGAGRAYLTWRFALPF